MQVVGEHAEHLGIGIIISLYGIVLCMNRTMVMNEVYPHICTCSSKKLSIITTAKKNNSTSYKITREKKFNILQHWIEPKKLGT
jgi:hypothetical protein